MSYNNIDSWQPYKKTEKILNRAMEHIKSVDYQVSLRWVFYRLLQDGFYSKKSDYAAFSQITSRARRAYWNKWHPLILTDETREMITYTGYGNPPLTKEEIQEKIEEVTEDTQYEYEELQEELNNFSCTYTYTVDPGYLQEYFIIIAFEARAMTQQFKKYAGGFTLCPCGGQPSIPYRFQTAEFINDQTIRYDKPAIVLYFGDCDKAGDLIFQSFKEDMIEWCDNLEEIIFCGLTEDQARTMNVPENIEKPGSFQWEALTDVQAREIIHTSIIQYYNPEIEKKAKNLSDELSERIQNCVNNALGF